MNTHQRRILIAVATIIAGMMLYPPFYYPRYPETSSHSGTPVRHGYDWLLSDGWGRVEVDLLLVQFLVVGVIGLIAYVLCADKKQ